MTAFVYNLATCIEAQLPTGSNQRACMTNGRKHVPHVAHFLTDAPLVLRTAWQCRVFHSSTE